MRSGILALALVSFAAVSCAKHPPDAARQIKVVRQFYSMVMSFKGGGVPSRAEIDSMSPLISGDFREALLTARAAEDREFQRTKGSEPPLVEGALFYSLFEGPDRLTSIVPDVHQGPNSFLVTFESGDPKDKRNFVKWDDRAVLKSEDGRWVVQDLELLGGWQFGAKGRLSDILRAVADTVDQRRNPRM